MIKRVGNIVFSNVAKLGNRFREARIFFTCVNKIFMRP